MMQKRKKLVVVLLVLSLLCAPVTMMQANAAETTGSKNNDWTYDKDNLNKTNTYFDYLQKHLNAASPNQEVVASWALFQARMFLFSPLYPMLSSACEMLHRFFMPCL